MKSFGIVSASGAMSLLLPRSSSMQLAAPSMCASVSSWFAWASNLVNTGASRPSRLCSSFSETSRSCNAWHGPKPRRCVSLLPCNTNSSRDGCAPKVSREAISLPASFKKRRRSSSLKLGNAVSLFSERSICWHHGRFVPAFSLPSSGSVAKQSIEIILFLSACNDKRRGRRDTATRSVISFLDKTTCRKYSQSSSLFPR
mmetsp:Transcript_8480/g.21838  ORF Transcript_8480/g.21838 Transcript_8480/m.21838 type:complete len:200 (+) Transcript_8480:388-987(+)